MKSASFSPEQRDRPVLYGVTVGPRGEEAARPARPGKWLRSPETDGFPSDRNVQRTTYMQRLRWEGSPLVQPVRVKRQRHHRRQDHLADDQGQRGRCRRTVQSKQEEDEERIAAEGYVRQNVGVRLHRTPPASPRRPSPRRQTRAGCKISFEANQETNLPQIRRPDFRKTRGRAAGRAAAGSSVGRALGFCGAIGRPPLARG